MILNSYTPTNVPTTYEFPTPYGSQEYSLNKILKVKITTIGQRSNQGHTMMLHDTL